jgi:hypothetical protein
MTEKTLLHRIQDWYLSNCDGEWEHDYGVEIETLDNPGWTVRICLKGTPLEGRAYPGTEFYRNGREDEHERDWYVTRLRDEGLPRGIIFEGAGGPAHLETILSEFLEFAGSA